MSNVAVIEQQQQTEQAPRLPVLQAGGAVRAIVPQDFDGAWRIANAVCKAGMAPRGLERAEQAMVAIMHGLEIGLTPMNALQSIAVVNGRPTIWGDGAIGLARGSGLLEWMEETFEGRPFEDGYTAICAVKRKGEPKPIRGSFSVADAKKAGLWGKSGPWQQYPKRMLQMRARASTLRDGFADVLKGLSIKEEVEDYQPMRDVTPREEPPAPPPPPALPAAQQTAPTAQDDAAEVEAAASEQATDAEVIPPAEPQGDNLEIPPQFRREAKPKDDPMPVAAKDPQGFVAWADRVLGKVADPDFLERTYNEKVQPHAKGMFPPDEEELLSIYTKHERRLGIG